VNKFRLTIQGDGNGLLVHNARLSDPLDPAAKALKKLSGKRNKTEEDHLQLSRVEFEGGLYFDDVVGPYIPDQNIFRALVDGAKLTKMGVKVTRGLFLTTQVNPLAYNGPRDVEGLWAAGNVHKASVKVGTQRVVRTRPWFREWGVEVEGFLDPSVMELAELQAVADNAGRFIGMGDWRPRFGRFNASVESISA
jgi:hypothetical protein